MNYCILIFQVLLMHPFRSFFQGVKLLRETLFPPLMCAAAAKGDLEMLKKLQQEVIMIQYC